MLKTHVEASEAGIVVTVEGERIELNQGGIVISLPETTVQELIDALVTVGGTVQKNRRTEQARIAREKAAAAAAAAASSGCVSGRQQR